jgi:hypothetical protein
MAWDNALPYGMRDIGLRTLPSPYTTPGSLVDLPNSRTFSFEEAEDFEELRGDDKVIAVRGKGASVNWELESGGISIPSFVVMNGGTPVTTGTTPNQVTTYTKKVTDVRPYFKASGAAVSDSGGDFQVNVMRARASENLTGELSDGAFWLTGASGTALPTLETGKVDVLYEFLLRESGTAAVS